MRPKPYIGITGVMSALEARTLVEAITPNLPNHHDLMVGVLASAKSLKGEQVTRPSRYPAVEQLATIMEAANGDRTVPMVHFHSQETDGKLLQQLLKVISLAGHCCRGIQLNTPTLTQSDVLKELLRQWPGLNIVAQINNAVWAKHNGSVTAIAHELNQRRQFTHSLLDFSEGENKPLNINEFREALRNFRSQCPQIVWAVAGGLSSRTISKIMPIIEAYPNISIDAEGGLRDDHDRLVLDEAIQYALRAADLLK